MATTIFFANVVPGIYGMSFMKKKRTGEGVKNSETTGARAKIRQIDNQNVHSMSTTNATSGPPMATECRNPGPGEYNAVHLVRR